MGGAALAFALALAVPGQTTLDVGLRTETRGGLARAGTSDEAVPTADASLQPAVAAATRMRGLALSADYHPELFLRGNLTGVTPLVFHRASANARVQATRDGPRVDTSLSIAGGDVDFSQAAEELGDPFGIGAAGGVLTLGSGRLQVEVSDTVGRLLWRQANELRVVSTRTAYGELLPPLQVLPTTSVELGYVLTRRDRAFATWEAGLALPHLLAASARSPRIHPAFAGTTPGARWEHRLSRDTDLLVSAGLLMAWQRTGHVVQEGEPVAYPKASVLVTHRLRAEFTRITLSGHAFVEPAYDPFLVGLTERAGARVTVGAWVARSLLFDGSLVGAARVHDTVPVLNADTARDRAFGYLSARLVWWLHENVALEAGGSANTRVADAGRIAPQLLAWVALTAGLGLDT